MSFNESSLRDVCRRIALWALLGVFTLRALIPVGYMPDFGSLAEGKLKVVICTGAGSKTIVLDAAGNSVPSRHTTKVDHPCAFAGMATAVTPSANLEGVTQGYSAHHFVFLALNHHFIRHSGPVLGPRGPPSFV
ncbi:MAG: hypothetical protein JSR89_13100 [Proteobacteria bacterium]|nr:hypothetical protein [Pseudomonadota bacterium]